MAPDKIESGNGRRSETAFLVMKNEVDSGRSKYPKYQVPQVPSTPRSLKARRDLFRTHNFSTRFDFIALDFGWKGWLEYHVMVQLLPGMYHIALAVASHALALCPLSLS